MHVSLHLSFNGLLLSISDDYVRFLLYFVFAIPHCTRLSFFNWMKIFTIFLWFFLKLCRLQLIDYASMRVYELEHFFEKSQSKNKNFSCFRTKRLPIVLVT